MVMVTTLELPLTTWMSKSSFISTQSAHCKSFFVVFFYIKKNPLLTEYVMKLVRCSFLQLLQILCLHPCCPASTYNGLLMGAHPAHNLNCPLTVSAFYTFSWSTVKQRQNSLSVKCSCCRVIYCIMRLDKTTRLWSEDHKFDSHLVSSKGPG